MAGPHPDLVGRVLLVAVLTPYDKGATPDIVLRVTEPSSRHGVALEVVLVLGTTERAPLEGHTLQPICEGPLLAFLAGRAPQGLLRALEALFPMGDRAADEPPPEEPAGPPNCDLDLELDIEVGADEDDEYLLS